MKQSTRASGSTCVSDQVMTLKFSPGGKANLNMGRRRVTETPRVFHLWNHVSKGFHIAPTMWTPQLEVGLRSPISYRHTINHSKAIFTKQLAYPGHQITPDYTRLHPCTNQMFCPSNHYNCTNNFIGTNHDYPWFIAHYRQVSQAFSQGVNHSHKGPFGVLGDLICSGNG